MPGYILANSENSASLLGEIILKNKNQPMLVIISAWAGFILALIHADFRVHRNYF